MKLRLPITSLLLLTTLMSCQENNSSRATTNSSSATTNEATSINTHRFLTQDAYQYIQKQVDFGPRIPGTPEHKACADWLYSELSLYVDYIEMKPTQVKIGDGTNKPCYNIFGQINPEAENRILLLAHWDTRPWADMENPPSTEPVTGADDGASGVGVLLALAKNIHQDLKGDLNVGIDILFTDVEDYGKTEWGSNSYAIGTRHWANEAKANGYQANFGILLDMVGAANARFAMEGFSIQYAPEVLQKVWKVAHDSGYGSYFVFEDGHQITDDHLPINQILKIPTIDIINLPAGSRTGFVPHWHTLRDDMSVINHQTLEAVGQTLLNLISEQH